MTLCPIGSSSPWLSLPTKPIASPLHHHLRQAGRPGEIILGDQQVTLLGDAIQNRIAYLVTVVSRLADSITILQCHALP